MAGPSYLLHNLCQKICVNVLKFLVVNYNVGLGLLKLESGY